MTHLCRSANRDRMSRNSPLHAEPRTPEPSSGMDEQAPAAPKTRFRVKRRHVSQQLVAPTQQFLASVAAADIAIPSVEEPEVATCDPDMIMPTFSLLDSMEDDQDVAGLDMSFIRGRTFSPPKTPAPGSVASLSPTRYPDWSIGSRDGSCFSSPEPESRPSTSRSTGTTASSFTQLSSIFSECAPLSPKEDGREDFICLTSGDDHLERPTLPVDRNKLPRRAPWTKAMSAHLWAVYRLYLSDPRVTPLMMSASGIPPEGVCRRVAREAIRSWKGSRAMTKTADSSDRKSGSSTPTPESSGTFMEWPHTPAATRHHLRALCRQKSREPHGGKLRYLTRSPTPFNSNIHTRRHRPRQDVAPFQTRDMITSLALSTSETMKPEAPLAQLACPSSPESALPDTPVAFNPVPFPAVDVEPTVAERRRLGSPFSAKSYGPSSSKSLALALGLPSPGMGQRQARTVGPRRALQSPVRLGHTITQKRKTQQPDESRSKRPSLGADTWLDPRSIVGSDGEVGATQDATFKCAESVQDDDPFRSQMPSESYLTSSVSCPQVTIGRSTKPPARLGSPFPGSASSFSVPNRLVKEPGCLEDWMADRPFSTIQRFPIVRSHETPRIDLAARRAHIERRLRELNGRTLP